MEAQQILNVEQGYSELDAYLKKNGCRVILLVCGSSIQKFKIGSYFEGLEEREGIKVIRFSEFEPNPVYESVVKGVEIFKKEHCDMIAAVGGGSAMDVAKCIKLFSNLDSSKNYLEQRILPNNTRLIVMPTTAGTGSEATKFAVLYYKGEKQSITDGSCIPSAIMFDPSVLKTLPVYQKKATMMDAFCHAVESFWSVHSTNESRRYSEQAIRQILKHKDGYLANTEIGNASMLQAARIAGKAINLTQTTAGHAMCYKLTGLYQIAHGHAAALCVSKLFPYMIEHTDQCADKRGTEYLNGMFQKLGRIMGCSNAKEAGRKLEYLMEELNLDAPAANENEIFVLNASVNPIRLKNNPVKLDYKAIDYLYRQILN